MQYHLLVARAMFKTSEQRYGLEGVYTMIEAPFACINKFTVYIHPQGKRVSALKSWYSSELRELVSTTLCGSVQASCTLPSYMHG
jgi:hypothetical protein